MSDPYAGLRPSQREHLAELLRAGDDAADSIADPVLRAAIKAVTKPNLEAIFFAGLHQENNTRMQIHEENLRLETKIKEDISAQISLLDRGLGVTNSIHDRLIEAQEALIEAQEALALRQDQALQNQARQRESLDQLIARVTHLELVTVGPGDGDGHAAPPPEVPLVDQVAEVCQQSRLHGGLLWALLLVVAALLVVALGWWVTRGAVWV